MADMKALSELAKLFLIPLGVLCGLVAEVVFGAVLARSVGLVWGIMFGVVAVAVTVWWIIKKSPKVPE